MVQLRIGSESTSTGWWVPVVTAVLSATVTLFAVWLADIFRRRSLWESFSNSLWTKRRDLYAEVLPILCVIESEATFGSPTLENVREAYRIYVQLRLWAGDKVVSPLTDVVRKINGLDVPGAEKKYYDLLMAIVQGMRHDLGIDPLDTNAIAWKGRRDEPVQDGGGNQLH